MDGEERHEGLLEDELQLVVTKVLRGYVREQRHAHVHHEGVVLEALTIMLVGAREGEEGIQVSSLIEDRLELRLAGVRLSGRDA